MILHYHICTPLELLLLLPQFDRKRASPMLPRWNLPNLRFFSTCLFPNAESVAVWRDQLQRVAVGQGNIEPRSPYRHADSLNVSSVLAGFRKERGFDDWLERASLGRCLQACGKAQALSDGKRVHEHIVRRGLERIVFLQNNLLSMYGKCGSVVDARRIFDNMSERNVVSWNAMITVYAERGHFKDVLGLFDQMLTQGAMPNKVTFIVMLSACASPEALAEGRLIHAGVVHRGFESDFVVANAAINMYGKCGDLEAARRIFDKVRDRDVVSWTAMISAFTQHGHGKEALRLFRQMQREGVIPNEITFSKILSACPDPAFLAEGRLIHAHIVERGFESDVIIATAIINMYGKCGNLQVARKIFDKTPGGNAVSWTAMITAYAQHGHGRESLKLFRQMQIEGVKPNEVTFSAVLNACSTRGDLAEGRLIHGHTIETGFESDAVVGTAIITMYGKCGCLEDAFKIFRNLSKRNVVTWNAMIAAYAQNDRGKEALRLFWQMRLEGVIPNKISFVTILDACASNAALAESKLIHVDILERSFETDVLVGNSIINMYGKCGSLEDAKTMFDKMTERDVISWNTMISAYAQHGCGKEALELFHLMLHEGVEPSEITFVSILTACSHTGLVDDGCHVFNLMTKDFGIIPMADHYACLIDLLGRAGRLDEAESLVNKMPFEPCDVLWTALLGACRIHGDVDRGQYAAEHVLEMDPQNDGAYVVLSNIYATASRWDDARKVRKAMADGGMKKGPGYSSIEVKNNVHEFTV